MESEKRPSVAPNLAGAGGAMEGLWRVDEDFGFLILDLGLFVNVNVEVNERQGISIRIRGG